MRTADQVRRKLTELTKQKQFIQQQLEKDKENNILNIQIEKLEDMTMMLEWVLNEPSGSYHG
ncbi:hypothetical protein [Paenibacillus lutrae]|uniref:Uncharacterized protein n=1 Tax=Paenibacillus lutrae TaxID=2078573 RepID=A0A7X3FEP9_9BACL|nr:hypothetical protein [Paenibacillus lutrae]MVO98128.1 hypothetical protein [Paenibacillus lutrae]